ncbi:hypothetical protein [Neobacillus jeddahensis]|uniref:hypothetical protein n=1 Tax=Neobacillus jeddahensis TaxID=1461580 RepID=UPI00058C9270|nr:hypothetical protein [Neobacillus jeddahensis]
MKGTAILYQEQNIMFIENVEHSFYERIREQCGCEQCSCKLDEKIVELGSVSPVFWHEDEIDWDYGY